ncbi:nitrite reductase [Shewanella waksmanii]|uniref:nitrite reductase n=1 Tax=Shewanella waksmanii TaxID=213783 RepID=UPI00048E1113|nr:nitrite reductase [Shewanella waksmanii]
MNSLILGIAVIMTAFITPFWVLHLRTQCQGQALNTKATPASSESKASGAKVPLILSVALLLATLLTYSQIGRFADWDRGFIDENIDYLIAADINKNARAVSEQPYNKIALLNLAHAYAEGGMYAESVDTLNQLLAVEGQDAELLGMKANALYYRDGRDMSLDVSITISQALAVDPFEVQSLLLLSTHAYLNKDYQQAIDHWQTLLSSENPSINRASINSAILKAEQKLTNRAVTASE